MFRVTEDEVPKATENLRTQEGNSLLELPKEKTDVFLLWQNQYHKSIASNNQKRYFKTRTNIYVTDTRWKHPQSLLGQIMNTS